MTLLQPWAAAVAGAVGLGVLTLLYVLKLRRKALRVGSTLLWEQALAEIEVNTPWRRLRIDWLFVLQALAIAALAVAVGRPAVGIGSARQRVVVVIDASASMGAGDGGQGLTRLEEAKRQAVELVENLRRARGLEAAVVELAGDGKIVRGFTRESAAVIEGIEGVKQTDEPGNLRAALEAIGSLTAGTAGDENDEGSVAYIFSDGGFVSPPLETPAGVSVRLVRIGPEPLKRAENVGIVAVSAQRDEGDPATVRVVARFLSTFAATHDVSVRLLLDGAPIGSSTVSLQPLGEQTVVLPVGVRGGGVLTLRVMNDDVLSSDNTAQVVIDGVREPAVVVVGPGASGKDANPLVVNFAQSVSPLGRVIGVESVPTDASAWKGVDLIVFDRVEPRGSAVPPVASVSLGAGLKGAGITLVPGTAGSRDRVVSWKRDNPLMRDVVLDGLVLTGVGHLRLPSQGVTLAEGVRGPLIGLVEGADGAGHVVCAFGAEQGGWGSDLSFVVFMGNTMDYLTLRGRTKAGRQIAAGDELSARVPSQGTELTVTAPDGVERRVTVAPASGSDGGLRVVALGRAASAGVYRIAGASEGEDRVAVNVSSEVESGVATSDLLPLRVVGGERISAAGRPSRPGEVWDWFVIGALGLLGAEWLLYAFLARK